MRSDNGEQYKVGWIARAAAPAAVPATATNMPLRRMKVSGSALVSVTMIVAGKVVMSCTQTSSRARLRRTPATGINGWNTAAMKADVRERPMMNPEARELGRKGREWGQSAIYAANLPTTLTNELKPSRSSHFLMTTIIRHTNRELCLKSQTHLVYTGTGSRLLCVTRATVRSRTLDRTCSWLVNATGCEA